MPAVIPFLSTSDNYPTDNEPDTPIIGPLQQIANITFQVSGNNVLYQVARVDKSGIAVWDETDLPAQPGSGGFSGRAYGIKFKSAVAGLPATISAIAFFQDDAVPFQAIQAGSSGGGSGTITDIISPDSSISITNPTGPTVSLEAIYRGTISDITSTGGTIAVTNPTGPTTNIDSLLEVTDGSTTVTPITEILIGSGLVLTNPSPGEAALKVATPANPGGTVLLYDYTVTGASKASIDTDVDGPYAGLFPTNFNILEIWMYARTDEAVVLSVVNMNCNNDFTAVYDRAFISTTITGTGVITDAGVGSGASSFALLTTGANATANVAGLTNAAIPNYSSTVFFKTLHWWEGVLNPVAGVTNRETLTGTFNYRSTAALTRILITPATAGKKFVVGSRLMVFAR